MVESACNTGDPDSIPGSGRSTGEGIGYPLQYSWVSLVAQLVKNPPAMRSPGFDPWVGKVPWRREWLPTSVFWPGEFHGLYSPRGRKESDTTERLSLSHVDMNPANKQTNKKSYLHCYVLSRESKQSVKWHGKK